ncbi:hypothetical protein ABVC54_00990 [Lactobacillus gasseri]|uniref:hypothetical protein n=1 Tax=Lactobacillus TaxID=1578 RepID=UPI0011955FDD|nr:hypothetical protein [Lactobacillus jensenii]MDK7308813.1 hypothetical protein [Lactobacillus jensenii]TVV22615.1 hypothetical protein FOF69_00650 [Lactobacillus jensenii]
MEPDNQPQYKRPVLLMPRSIKYHMTVMFVPLMDIIAIMGFGALGLKLASSLGLSPIFSICLVIFCLFLGVMLIANTCLTRIPNWKVLLAVLKQDRNKYYPLYLKGEVVRNGKN